MARPKEVPGRCSSCPFWKHLEGKAQHMKSGRILGAVQTIEIGECYLRLPVLMPMQMQPQLAGGEVTMQMQRVFPQMREDELCSDHPDWRARVEGMCERARIIEREKKIEFNPQAHGDASGGFNRPPSFEEAQRLAAAAPQAGET